MNGNGKTTRPGARTLSLVATPLAGQILRTLGEGPERQSELRRSTGSPAQSTLRAQLRRLVEVGAIERHRRSRFPGTIECELTAAGKQLLSVLGSLGSWLEQAPTGPLRFESSEAKAATSALINAWSTTILRALAAGPLSLTELDRLIAALSYPALERRLGALKLAGLIRAQAVDGRATPYLVTDWLRRGVGPLVAATHWERLHVPKATVPVGQLDAETTLLLAVPLVRTGVGRGGTCRLGIEVGQGQRRRLCGVIVELTPNGGIGSCTTNLRGTDDAWALGGAGAWLAALVEGDQSGVELGGDRELARSLVGNLHEALFKDAHNPSLT